MNKTVIACAFHPQLNISHCCSLSSCSLNSFFCSECLLEEWEHITLHKEHICGIDYLATHLQQQSIKHLPDYSILRQYATEGH